MGESKRWNELDTEYPPAGEDATIAEIVRITEELMRLRSQPALRGQHARATGVARARFEIAPDRPTETRVGVFAKDKTYDAIVRFSNGSGEPGADSQKDARGLAIKLLSVEGPRALPESAEGSTQDFIMINAPAFPFRDAAEYLELSRNRLEGRRRGGSDGERGGLIRFFIPWRLGRFLFVARQVQRTTRSPLIERYWSMSPYRLGKRAIKFMVVPHRENGVDAPAQVATTPDGLGKAVADHLAKHEARFDFLVQFQTDPRAMPIEDPTVAWDESVSKPVKVATLVIDRVGPGDARAAELPAEVERMAFNPWHALEAHRPLGGINRLRRAVYQLSTRLRRELAASPK